MSDPLDTLRAKYYQTLEDQLDKLDVTVPDGKGGQIPLYAGKDRVAILEQIGKYLIETKPETKFGGALGGRKAS